MKNELSSLYEQVLLKEAEKSNLENPSSDTVGSIKPKQDLFGVKPKVVEGPDKAKVENGPAYKQDVGSVSKVKSEKPSFKGSAPAKDNKAEEPEEMKDEDVTPETDEEKENKKKEKQEESFTMSAFENLFKKTITEELGDEMTNDTSNFMDDAESTDTAEMTDEVEETEGMEEEEEEDLLSDLKDLQERINTIISKLETAVEEEGEETDDEEFSDEDFETEFGTEETEEEPVKESVEKMKQLSDAHGKKLMHKKNKVGKLHPKGGKAHSGNVDADPKLKAAKSHDKSLQNPKGKPEVKSTVKKGDFIK